MAAKKKFITINGKKYTVKGFDFNMVCELEDMGFSIEDMGNKPMGMVRAYAGICMGVDKDLAGIELANHIENGGNFDEILEAISYEVENSGFFRSLNKTEEA